jgi:hypothetical protein
VSRPSSVLPIDQQLDARRRGVERVEVFVDVGAVGEIALFARM